MNNRRFAKGDRWFPYRIPYLHLDAIHRQISIIQTVIALSAKDHILVTPQEITLTGVCGSSDSEIQISNQGDANLDVMDLSIVGTGWSVQDVGLPELLPPDAKMSLLVTGGEGDAVLRIDSNDPDSPTVTVELPCAFLTHFDAF